MATRGAVDHYTIQRGANYYNGLLTGNDNDFHELLTKYAIYPGDGIPGYKPETIGSVGVRSRATKQVLVEAHANNITTAKIDSGHKVGYINLSLSGRQRGITHPGDRIEFQATFSPTPGYVPTYFLPWADDFAIRLTIPPMGQGTGKGRSDPGIFFTAAISGCSVIFQGTPDNPTIYHCGGNSGYPGDLDNGAAFWEAVVDEFIADDAANARRDRGQVQASVDKRDYVTQTGVTSVSLIGGRETTMSTTARTKKYADRLRGAEKKDKLIIEDVAPWGCVLGRRDAQGDWTFYLQENATITYRSVDRSRILHRKKISVEACVSRPLVHREIFPNGPKHVAIRAPLPRIV